MIYTLTLNPAIDYTVFLDTLDLGEINRTEKESVSWGGKGINVSRDLNAFGVPNIAMGLIAGFTGRALAEGLAAEKVQTDLLTLSRGRTRINVKIEACHETEINGPGPEVSPREFDSLLEKIRALKKTDILVLSGNAPASITPVMYEDLLGAVSYSGACFVADVSGDALPPVLRHRPFLIKPNLDELSGLFARALPDEEDIAEAASEAVMRGAKNVLVSMGGRGAMLVNRKGVLTVPAPSGQVHSSVGAGDAMLAAFLAAILQEDGRSLSLSLEGEAIVRARHALRMAVAAGSAAAFDRTPCAPPKPEAVQALLDRVSLLETRKKTI